MKWKCNGCVWGPCVYESAKDDNDLMRTDKCPRGALITRWQKMSDEEPEQKRDNGLPEWLKVGNFVVFDKEKKKKDEKNNKTGIIAAVLCILVFIGGLVYFLSNFLFKDIFTIFKG